MPAFDDLPQMARAAYRTARARALRKGKHFLTPEEFVRLWDISDGRCALTGIRFSNEIETYEPTTSYKRLTSYPWQPSLDQISPGMGYSVENCQIVCKCVNIGKSSYSQETFLTWVAAAARQLSTRN